MALDTEVTANEFLRALDGIDKMVLSRVQGADPNVRVVVDCDPAFLRGELDIGRLSRFFDLRDARPDLRWTFRRMRW